tara:strand:- start:1690 stop:2628 length:939 start_codon:yes stop_codon:yes gene_type:complete
MSNILIIKHGSLGDIVQISGVIKDIKEANKDKKIFILTTLPYVELFSRCPYLDGVIMDKRLPRWNIFYLFRLRNTLSKFNFEKVFDLQNSSRTSFYRKFILRILDWSSTETSLKKGQKKKDFDKESVLDRFKVQLESSGVVTQHCLKPDFTWATVNVDKIINKFFGKKFILLFPFCSPQLPHKKWPHFSDLIKIFKTKHSNFEIAIAPNFSEIEEAKQFDATIITDNNKPLNIMELAGLIAKASYVVANDTGPAHMTAHLNKIGTVLFGHHTTAKKVSIETEKFKAISVENLNELSADKVYSIIKERIELIN